MIHQHVDFDTDVRHPQPDYWTAGRLALVLAYQRRDGTSVRYPTTVNAAWHFGFDAYAHLAAAYEDHDGAGAAWYAVSDPADAEALTPYRWS